MTPFKVTFQLATEVVVSPHPVHLDALVAFAAFTEHEVLHGPATDKVANEIHESLPLKKVEYGQKKGGAQWIYAASQLLWGEPGPMWQESQTLFVDPQDYALLRDCVRNPLNYINKGTGQYKSYDLRRELRRYKSAVAYAIGDIGEVQALLEDHLKSVGKLSRLQKGKIIAIKCEEIPEPTCYWQYRNLPSEMKNDIDESRYAPVQATVCPPYWRRENAREALAFLP